MRTRTARRVRTTVLLALIIIGVPISASIAGGWGTAIWLVIGAIGLLVLGPLFKSP
jgi:hypothetical protein